MESAVLPDTGQDSETSPALSRRARMDLTLPQRIETYLIEHGGEYCAVRDIAEALHAPHKNVTPILQRMADAGRCKRQKGARETWLYMIDAAPNVALPAGPRAFKPYVMPQNLRERMTQIQRDRDAVKSYFGPMTPPPSEKA